MRGRMPTVDNSELDRWRAMDAAHVLVSLADHVKADAAFRPAAAEGTTRVHVSAAGRDWELLLRGTRFFNTRTREGGGGAVDLAMHLFGVPFKAAVSLLRKHGL